MGFLSDIIHTTVTCKAALMSRRFGYLGTTFAIFIFRKKTEAFDVHGCTNAVKAWMPYNDLNRNVAMSSGALTYAFTVTISTQP